MSNYKQFIHNISLLAPEELNKIQIHRGYSSSIIPTFSDDYFDIIYIDGNHDTPYVLEDAIHSLKKVKNGGYLIFDDTQCPEVQQALAIFLHIYQSFIQQTNIMDGQLIVTIKKP